MNVFLLKDKTSASQNKVMQKKECYTCIQYSLHIWMTTIVNKTVSCHIIIEEAGEDDAASEGGTDIVEDEEEDKDEEEPPPFPSLTRLTSIQPLRQGSSSRSADTSGNGGGHTVWRWWIDGAQGNAGTVTCKKYSDKFVFCCIYFTQNHIQCTCNLLTLLKYMYQLCRFYCVPCEA